MAKGQRHGNREVRKPKKKPALPAVAVLAAQFVSNPKKAGTTDVNKSLGKHGHL